MEYLIKKNETKGVIITFTPDVKLKEKDTFNLPVQITNGESINV
jgi:hypothetical protein